MTVATECKNIVKGGLAMDKMKFSWALAGNNIYIIFLITSLVYILIISPPYAKATVIDSLNVEAVQPNGILKKSIVYVVRSDNFSKPIGGGDLRFIFVKKDYTLIKKNNNEYIFKFKSKSNSVKNTTKVIDIIRSNGLAPGIVKESEFSIAIVYINDGGTEKEIKDKYDKASKSNNVQWRLNENQIEITEGSAPVTPPPVTPPPVEPPPVEPPPVTPQPVDPPRPLKITPDTIYDSVGQLHNKIDQLPKRVELEGLGISDLHTKVNKVSSAIDRLGPVLELRYLIISISFLSFILCLWLIYQVRKRSKVLMNNINGLKDEIRNANTEELIKQTHENTDGTIVLLQELRGLLLGHIHNIKIDSFAELVKKTRTSISDLQREIRDPWKQNYLDTVFHDLIPLLNVCKGGIFNMEQYNKLLSQTKRARASLEGSEQMSKTPAFVNVLDDLAKITEMATAATAIQSTGDTHTNINQRISQVLKAVRPPEIMMNVATYKEPAEHSHDGPKQEIVDKKMTGKMVEESDIIARAFPESSVPYQTKNQINSYSTTLALPARVRTPDVGARSTVDQKHSPTYALPVSVQPSQRNLCSVLQNICLKVDAHIKRSYGQCGLPYSSDLLMNKCLSVVKLIKDPASADHHKELLDFINWSFCLAIQENDLLDIFTGASGFCEAFSIEMNLRSFALSDLPHGLQKFTFQSCPSSLRDHIAETAEQNSKKFSPGQLAEDSIVKFVKPYVFFKKLSTSQAMSVLTYQTLRNFRNSG